MNYVEMKAPAKINLGLNIISKRDDGYHNLETIFYPIYDLFDKIVVEKSDSFRFTSDNAHLTDDESNLIVRATRLLENKFKKIFNINIYLEKIIPMGAGLGGGSSDAAAILLVLNDMFKLGLSYGKLSEIALTLGSDVPYFLKPKPALGKSRGEELEFLEIIIDKPILLVNPGIHISTKEAFQNIKPTPLVGRIELGAKIASGDVRSFNGLLSNDFENYVFERHPEISGIREALVADGALFSQMTGTGSTIYGIFEDIESAERSKKRLPENYFTFISHHGF